MDDAAVVRARFQPRAGQAFDHARGAAAGRHRARRGQSDHPAAHDGNVYRRVAHRTCGRKRSRQGMTSDSASAFSDTFEWPCRRSTKTIETSPIRAPWRRASPSGGAAAACAARGPSTRRRPTGRVAPRSREWRPRRSAVVAGRPIGFIAPSFIAPSFMALSLSSVCSISIGPPRLWSWRSSRRRGYHADIGMVSVMPTSWLCRVDRRSP